MQISKLLLLPLAVAVFFASAARAQEIYDVPAAEIGLNYSYLNIGEGALDNSHLPLGWQLSFDSNVTNWLGLVAEFSGHYGDRNLPAFTDTPGDDFIDDVFDSNSDVHTFQIGPRFFFRNSGRFVPYAHVLFGLMRIHTDTDDLIVPPPAGFDDVQTPFLVTFGGGIDLHASPAWAFRAIQVDYLQTRMDDAPQHYMKISAGVNFKWHK
jgi:hypothetical protein